MGRSTASKPQPFDYSEAATALADMLAGAARGTTATATGFYGDIEDLVRKYGKGLPANVIRSFLPTREGKETLLPTVEEMNAMLPPVVPTGASRSPQVANVYNDLGMANPLAPTAGAAVVKGAKVAAPLIKAGALDLVRSEPARRAVNQVVRATGAGPMEIMAYQGSPHKFAPTEKNPLGEFDSTKIGSGEGAQAYGHGHYLAESPKTGQRYKESTSANMYQTPSGVIRSSDLVDELLKNSGEVPKQLQSAYNAKANEVVRDLIMGKSSQEIATEIKNSKYGGMYQGLINAVESVAPKKAEGHLYTVDLPDEKIAQMLNWDRPLSEQASHIQDFARAHDPNFSSKEPHFVTPQGEAIHWSGLLDNPEDLQNPRLKAIGKKIYRGGDWVDYGDYMMNKTTGADLYKKLSSPSEWHNQVSAGTGKAGLEDVDASALLRAHGIPGIRYLDEMSRDAGQGTSNFVVFPGEEDALTILKREKEGGAIHMGAGGTVKKGIELVDTFLKALKEGETAATAADRAAAGRAGAALIKATPQVKASEALGQAMEKGFKKTTTTQSDRTRVGGGNIGGAPFSAISEADPRYAGKVWGVMDQGTASRLANLTSPDTAWSTMLGSATQLKTNPVVFAKLEKQFKKGLKEGRLQPELEDKINQNLGLFLGEGANIRDPEIWKMLDTFEKRASMADLMMGKGLPPKKGGVALGGEKSGKGVIFNPTETLIEETERGLLHPEHGGYVPTFAVGPRLFSLTGESSFRPDLHPGFPTLLEGKDLGVNMMATPTEVYLPDWHARFKANNPERQGPGYYDLALGVKGEGLPSQELNEDYIRHLIREGYAEGGEVDSDGVTLDDFLSKQGY